MDWYLEEASTIFYPMSARCQFEQDACELYAWIMTWIRQNNWRAIRKTDIERYGPNRLRRAEKLTPVLNQLICQGIYVSSECDRIRHFMFLFIVTMVTSFL